MGRKPSKEDIERISMTISKSHMKMLETAMALMGYTNRSEYLGFLIENHNSSLNPDNQLDNLEKEEQNILSKLNEIKAMKRDIMKHKESLKDINRVRKQMRQEALAIIQKKLINKDDIGAENISRTWALRLGCSSEELLAESLILMKKGINLKEIEKTEIPEIHKW